MTTLTSACLFVGLLHRLLLIILRHLVAMFLTIISDYRSSYKKNFGLDVGSRNVLQSDGRTFWVHSVLCRTPIPSGVKRAPCGLRCRQTTPLLVLFISPRIKIKPLRMQWNINSRYPELDLKRPVHCWTTL
ncbi:hypothetical protein J6590_084620 [Homalodisca vitripennis]|nr:hypothetical protein J6590_084620 [Homalodisca vitripennis]